jgi:hypothetical protein
MKKIFKTVVNVPIDKLLTVFGLTTEKYMKTEWTDTASCDHFWTNRNINPMTIFIGPTFWLGYYKNGKLALESLGTLIILYK